MVGYTVTGTGHLPVEHIFSVFIVDELVKNHKSVTPAPALWVGITAPGLHNISEYLDCHFRGCVVIRKIPLFSVMPGCPVAVFGDLKSLPRT